MSPEAESHPDAPPQSSEGPATPPAQRPRKRWLDVLGWVILLVLLFFVSRLLVDFGRWMILPVPKLW